jgi:hypothetical protein
LSVPELFSLIDRLRAGSVSMMFPDMPLLKSDLRLAAAALQAFVRTMKPEDWLKIDNGPSGA